MSQPSVLIISDEPEFASTMMARWQTERSVPTFLLMTTPAWSESLVASCDLAVIAGVKEVVAPLFKKVDESGKPAILLAPDGLPDYDGGSSKRAHRHGFHHDLIEVRVHRLDS